MLNRRQVCILPASELLPFAEETTAADAAGRMEDAARRLKKEHAAIRQRLLDDAELLRQGIAPPGADRYMAAVCPDKTTAFDYLAQDTILCAGEAAGCRRRSGPFCSRPVRMLPPPWRPVSWPAPSAT